MNSFILTSSSTLNTNGVDGVFTYVGTNNSYRHPYIFHNSNISVRKWRYTDTFTGTSISAWANYNSTALPEESNATPNCNIYAYSVATLDEAADIGEVSRPSTGGNKCIVSGTVDTYGCKIVTSPSVVYDTIYHCVNYVDLEKKQIEPTEYTLNIDLYPYEEAQQGGGNTDYNIYTVVVSWDGASIPKSKLYLINASMDTYNDFSLGLLGHLKRYQEGAINEQVVCDVQKMKFTISNNEVPGSLTPFTYSWEITYYNGTTITGSSDAQVGISFQIPISYSTTPQDTNQKVYRADEYTVDKTKTVTRPYATTDDKTLNFIFTLHKSPSYN